MFGFTKKSYINGQFANLCCSKCWPAVKSAPLRAGGGKTSSSTLEKVWGKSFLPFRFQLVHTAWLKSGRWRAANWHWLRHTCLQDTGGTSCCSRGTKGLLGWKGNLGAWILMELIHTSLSCWETCGLPLARSSPTLCVCVLWEKLCQLCLAAQSS